ncbi:MAG: TatD family hydrolase [Rudaea sp.]
MNLLIDSHCHLDAAQFDADREQVLQRARAAGVGRLIVPAVCARSFEKLRDMCRAYSGLFPAYGLHPMFMADHRRDHIAQLKRWIASEQPVAIGECGLDFHVEDSDVDEQRFYFRAQLELARESGLPVIVHARKALDEVINEIRKLGKLRGVIHSFSGSLEQAKRLWDLGFCVGIGGPVTYERARRLRSIVATMPIEFLLLETDAPDQPLHGHQGTRNEPVLLMDVCNVAAHLRNAEFGSIAAATTRNCEQMFGISQ